MTGTRASSPAGSIAAVLLLEVLFATTAHAQSPGAPPPAAPGAPEPPRRTTGSVTVSFAANTGRSDLLSTTVMAAVERPLAGGGRVSASTTYSRASTLVPGDTERLVVVDQWLVAAGTLHPLKHHLVVLQSALVERDSMTALDHRVAESVGVGVRLGHSRVTFTAAPFVSVVHQDRNLQADRDGLSVYSGLTEKLTVAVAPGWTLSHNLEAFRGVKHTEDLFFFSDTSLTGSVTPHFGVNVSYHFDRESLLISGLNPWNRLLQVGVQWRF